MPQRHRLTGAEKRVQAKIKKEKAYAFYDAGARKRAKPKLKQSAVVNASSGPKKSEDLRKKYTPSGLQSLVDVMSKKKKK
jgi:hypothetical protein